MVNYGVDIGFSLFTKLSCYEESYTKHELQMSLRSKRYLCWEQKTRDSNKRNSKYLLMFLCLNTDLLVDYLHMARRTVSLGILCCHHTNR